jgi:hypothetical protein
MIWRRVRGLLVVSMAWSVAWGVLGSAWAAAQLWWTGRHDGSIQMSGIVDVLPTLVFLWSFFGGFSGAVFAALLMWLERRRSIDNLLGRRVAAWGALGGATLPLVVVALGGIDGRIPSDWVPASLVAGALGALSAAVTVRLARATHRTKPD